MTQVLMPKATAVWLIDNTALSFQQIADFTALHLVEVQAIADGEVVSGMQGVDPLQNGQLTAEEIARCEGDETATLQLHKKEGLPEIKTRHKGPRYTPVSKRDKKPDAIHWLITHHPELVDSQIGRLVGTTKRTIESIRLRDHWKFKEQSIAPQSPVEIGLCTQMDMSNEINKAIKAGRQPLEKPKEESEENGNFQSSGSF